MIPLNGFSPDADPTTPGIITDCTNFVPYLTGMEGGPSEITPTGVPVLAAECRGGAVITKLDGTRRTFAGTAAALFELSGGSWVDRSDTGGYALGAETRWTFAQFGDSTLATAQGTTIQRSTTGSFAAIAGAPEADIIFTVGAFVMALNTNDGSDKFDGWHCCAAFDDTSWSPSITTQAAKGRLVSSPGALTAGARLGEYAVAYKTRSIFLGQYVGAPAVWDWIPVAGGDVGCVGKDALCDIGNVHFFVGEDNFYVFDGTAPIPVADNQVRQWFYNNSSPELRYKIKCVYDRQNDRVWIFYPSKNAGDCDSALVWHVKAKRWGRADRAIQAALNYISAATTYDTLSSVSATYDALPSVAYDSQYWLAGGRSLSVVTPSRQLVVLDGASTSSSFTTGEYGDDDALSLLKRVRLRYADAPTTASCTVRYSMNSGTTFTTGATGAMDDGKFDVLQTGRWHQATVSFTGDVQVTGIKAEFVPSGMR